jgi:ribosome-binding factor A
VVRPIELKLDLELCFAESEELQEGIIKKYLSKLSGEKKESLEKIIDQLKDPNLSTKVVTKLSMHSDPGIRSIAVSHPNIDKETLKKIASALNHADEDEDREEGIQNLRLAVLEKYFGNTDLPLDVPYEECEEEPEIGQKRMRPQYSILPLKSMKHEEEEEISYYEPNDEE